METPNTPWKNRVFQEFFVLKALGNLRQHEVNGSGDPWTFFLPGSTLSSSMWVLPLCIFLGATKSLDKQWSKSSMLVNRKISHAVFTKGSSYFRCNPPQRPSNGIVNSCHRLTRTSFRWCPQANTKNRAVLWRGWFEIKISGCPWGRIRSWSYDHKLR